MIALRLVAAAALFHLSACDTPTAFFIGHAMRTPSQLPAPTDAEIYCGSAHLDMGSVSNILSEAYYAPVKGNAWFEADVRPIIASQGGVIGSWQPPLLVRVPDDQWALYREYFPGHRPPIPRVLQISGFAIPRSNPQSWHRYPTVMGMTRALCLRIRETRGIHQSAQDDVWTEFDAVGDQSPCV